MAHSGLLLLLLLAVLPSHLPEVQARPTDFWCDYQVRKKMEERTEELREDAAECVGADVLPAPVQLPAVSVRAGEWTNTALQRKRAEVAGALQLLQEGVQAAWSRSASQCQMSLLKTLERHISTHLLIVNQIRMEDDPALPPPPPQPAAQDSQTSLIRVLEQYRRLLRGKLERLAVDLQESLCAA